MSPLLTLACPFYNESEVIDIFFDCVFPILRSLDIRFEIVCVNDGSNDDTLIQLRAHAKAHPEIRVVDFSRNFGKEAALSAAIDYAKGDAVVIIDADLQDPPELIVKMVALWRQGFDVVLAQRQDRSSDGWIKRTTANAFYRLHNAMADRPIPVDVGDFRLLSRRVVDAIKLLPERKRFMKGLLSWVGFSTTTIGYVRAQRAAGVTKFSGWRLWNLALEGFTSFSTIPLRVWTYIGASIAVVAFFYALFIVFFTLLQGREVPGYASLLAAILFLGGVQLLVLGVIGEYVGRIYAETKQRPLYIVREEFSSPLVHES